jgi:FtsZ-interacting cell division protein ZipA
VIAIVLLLAAGLWFGRRRLRASMTQAAPVEVEG